MEDVLKEQVVKVLEGKLGYSVTVSHEEWEEAKRDALNDIYSNRLCFLKEASLECFINVMADILYCAVCVPA